MTGQHVELDSEAAADGILEMQSAINTQYKASAFIIAIRYQHTRLMRCGREHSGRRSYDPVAEPAVSRLW
jgi:hypothetical protein